MSATVSALFGWAVLGLVPLTAIVGVVLRRFGRGSFIMRLRPHFILGYAAVVATVLHLSTTLGAMGGANAQGIWLATFAFAALCVQAFLGASLQAPGSYRKPLRRWHVVTFVATLALAVGHIALNAG